jgi:hypothetical protein
MIIRDMVKYEPKMIPVPRSIIPITLCLASIDTAAFLGYKTSISRWLPNQDERLLFK